MSRYICGCAFKNKPQTFKYLTLSRITKNSLHYDISFSPECNKLLYYTSNKTCTNSKLKYIFYLFIYLLLEYNT